ncbi:MAG: acyltransferase family protein [Bacteroidota bacterium]
MERRYDIDWLRVIAIILVLYFHVAMIFTAEWDFHIKNPETSNLWLEFNFWLSRFRMPLLFFISGAGSFFALRKRSGKQFVYERAIRLLIPLIFSMFIIVPPQLYFERLMDADFTGSFGAFYLTKVLQFMPYPEGNFSWHHMWFVLYLFWYSVLAAPLFLFLRSKKGSQLMEKLAFMEKGSWIYLIALPTVLIYMSWTIRFDRTNDLIHDFGWFPYWMSFFVMGYFVALREGFWDSLARNARTSLGWAILLIVVINMVRWNRWEPWVIYGKEWTSHGWAILYRSLYPMLGWAWLLAALGYGRKYLNRPHPILTYANRGIYPFYILHQTVLIILGYYVIQVEESILAKYLFVSTITFFLCIAIYEYLIRPFALMRFLFGVKSVKLPKKKVVPAEKAQLQIA